MITATMDYVRQLDHDEMDRKIAQYLAEGNVIKVYPRGQSGDTKNPLLRKRNQKKPNNGATSNE